MIRRGVLLCQCTWCLKVFFCANRGLQLESYRSTTGPRGTLCTSIFVAGVTAVRWKGADSIGRSSLQGGTLSIVLTSRFMLMVQSAGGQASQAMDEPREGSTPRFMLSSMHARNLLSSPCPAGTKPTFPWRQSSRTASYKFSTLMRQSLWDSPPSGRLRLPRSLKPAFLSPQPNHAVILRKALPASSSGRKLVGGRPRALRHGNVGLVPLDKAMTIGCERALTRA